MNEVRYIHIIEKFFGDKEEQMHATTWMNLETIMLSERNQSQKDTHCMSPLMWSNQNSYICRDRKYINGFQEEGVILGSDS